MDDFSSNSLKVYVEVEVCFREDGVMLPRLIVWENGLRYGFVERRPHK